MDDASAVRAAEELLAGREQAEVVADAVARVLDGSADAEAAVWVAQQIFSRSADGRPLVLAVDDGHVTETSAIDELRSGVLGSAGAVSLLIGARPELLDDVDRRTHPDPDLELAPLPAAAAAQIVDSLLGGSVDAGLRARIVDAAGGNPLFLSETLRMLLEDGSSTGSPGDRGNPPVRSNTWRSPPRFGPCSQRASIGSPTANGPSSTLPRSWGHRSSWTLWGRWSATTQTWPTPSRSSIVASWWQR